MTTQLPERLRDLAEDAPGPLSAAGLWRDGQRRHRRRVVTAMTVVGAVVVLLAGVGYGDHRSRQPDPAAPPATQSGPMSIPDRFYDPSPWLPSTSSPGRLVAVIPSVEQHHVVGGPSEGVVGVAAGSQRYAFLDLADRFPDTPVQLAPDGLHLAYVVTGTTSRKRDPHAGGGVAIIDLRTGRVENHLVNTEHGFNNQTLVWASPSTLLVDENDVLDGPGHHTRVHHQVFRMVVGSPQTLPLRPDSAFGLDDSVSVRDGVGYLETGHRIRLLDPATGSTTAVIRLERSAGNVALDRSRRHVAGLRGGGYPGQLRAGVVRNGKAALAAITPARSLWDPPLGWSDPSRVVAVHVSRPSLDDPRLMSVDVRTHRTEALSSLAVPVQLAQEAVYAAHPVHAVPPQHPWNRRTLALSVLVALLTVAGVVVFDRRSRRVRR